MEFRKLAAEPLVHFLLIGALLFGVDRVRSGRRAEAPAPPGARGGPTSEVAPSRTIVVDPKTMAILTEEAASAHGRPPTAAELDEAVTRWIDDEVLYREGRALGLERDDPRVRLRVAQKMVQVLETANAPPAPTDEELQHYFHTHRAEWSTAELVDFTQVYVRGDDAAARTRADGLLAELQRGAEPAKMGDPFAGGRRYRRRAVADLAESFGPEFAAGLTKETVGRWHLRRSRLGFHLVRLDKLTPADVPDFASAREDVALRWKKEELRRRTGAAVEELRKRYEIRRTP